MKKWSIILLVTLLMASCIALAGCGKEKEKAEPTSSTPAVEEKGSSNELADIMKSAQGAQNMSFDIISTINNQGQTIKHQGKYYISGQKMRMENEAAGMKSIMIVNGKGEIWMYNPADKTAMKMPEIKDKTEMPNAWAEGSDLSAMKVVGHEKMDGYDCVVVTVNEADGTNKMWLREDIGMPVKLEAKTPEGTMLIEYKNYKLGTQSADLFELPTDAQVFNMPDMSKMPQATGMPKMPNQ